ncbi:hypothetical protein BDP27DRAFT_1427117 [Rhodocollybia butyracea]|uniref:Uncharacterized protein n=1 Tax=Rhodocollybia butyracea TaxID=206335 RepID=A0A9P5U275_9AGAR|nr:hypothetical protein BDP27DRAFT_1427117 [Rhodocollybia butyracea]
MEDSQDSLAYHSQPLTAGREAALAIHFAFPSIQLLLVASLHNGSIQLWNHCMGVLVDCFKAHEGPARTLCRHPSRAWLVSGTDVAWPPSRLHSDDSIPP